MVVVCLLTCIASATYGQGRRPEVDLSLINDTGVRAVSARRGEREEDLQVLTRMVEESVGGMFWRTHHLDLAGSGHGWFTPQTPNLIDGHAGAAKELTAPIADYIDGWGVIVQMRIPAPLERRSSAKPPADPLSRWERTRRRVQGLSPLIDPMSVCAKCHAATNFATSAAWNAASAEWEKGLTSRPTHDEVVGDLIGVLAEVGSNFRHLAVTDRIVLSLQYEASPSGRANAPEPAVGNQERIGDLRLKQGQLDLAMEAYEKVLAEMKTGADDAEGLVHAAYLRVVLKLASCQEQQGESEAMKGIRAAAAALRKDDPSAEQKGLQLLQAAIEDHLDRQPRAASFLTRVAAHLARVETSPATAKRKGRIRVVATKAMLDELAAGTLTKRAFAAAVKVERTRGGAATPQR
jgi:hypothetical protein